MLHDDTFINYHYHMFPARDIFTFIWYFFYNQLASLSVPAQNALRIIRNQDSVFYVHSFQATKKKMKSHVFVCVLLKTNRSNPGTGL
jgi:hypothetical protein